MVTRGHSSGFTLVELLVSVVILGLLMVGINSVVTRTLQSQEYVGSRNELMRDAEFAMDRMVHMVSHSPHLLLPMVDKAATNWPENIREQTEPASPPVGASVFASAVLAVTLPTSYDLDFDGIADADDDGDGQVDEDIYGDVTNDFAPGIYQVDDDGDGYFDENGFVWWDDDEGGFGDEDPINGIDDDNDGLVDEDPYRDINSDGSPGFSGVDDDGDGQIDEGNSTDDDEDGQSDEDTYNPAVYFLFSGEVIERLPVPWDENGDSSINGRDFVFSTIADNVTRLRFERVPQGNDLPPLIDITLELTNGSGDTVSLNSRVRVGGAL